MRNVNTPTNHHQQEIQEFRVQQLADDPVGWADGVPWYRTTIHRIKMMANGAARIIPFLAASGTPTANTVGSSGTLGSSSDAALADHAHANPGLAVSGSSGFMSGTHVDNLATAYSHAGATGNPHGTTIGNISGLQTALDGKSPVGHGHAIGDVTGLTTALSAKADLDGGGKVPASQLPSYVDDVLEYADRASFPATGEAGKIYLAISPSQHQWRWTGSTYADITSEAGDQYNMGTLLDGAGDPFTSRGSYDGRGGVRAANGVGPFGAAYYNMIDVRSRNIYGDPANIWGGELAWGMTAYQNRLAFRSRGADGTPTAWVEVSAVGHAHAVSDVTDLQASLDGKLIRIPSSITGFDANSYMLNGIHTGYNVTNAPNSAWGVLRVHRNGDDDGDQLWQIWSCAGYTDAGRVYRRWSHDNGSTWSDWISSGALVARFWIGDGTATTFTLAHYLGTKDVRVTVRRNSAPWDMVEVSDELDGADPDNKVKLTFYGEVPTTNEYRVVVMG